MYVTKDGQMLHLTNWNYNALLIMKELARVVTEHGGRVKPARTAMITNRSITESILEYTRKIQNLRFASNRDGRSEARDNRIAEYEQKIAHLESINNDPVVAWGESWIRFVVDGTMYYYSFDDNPFFPFHFVKTPLIDNLQYSIDAYSQEDKKDWLYDCYIISGCTENDHAEAARHIFDMLMKAPYSTEYRKKKRVRNYGRSGYHYEYEPARVATMQF